MGENEENMSPSHIKGRKFGKLTPLWQTHRYGRLYWFCKCDCGNTTYATSYQLTKKKIKTCGCGIRPWGKEPYCMGCRYYVLLNSTQNKRYCDYITITGHKRPCKFGDGCTERKEGKGDLDFLRRPLADGARGSENGKE